MPMFPTVHARPPQAVQGGPLGATALHAETMADTIQILSMHKKHMLMQVNQLKSRAYSYTPLWRLPED